MQDKGLENATMEYTYEEIDGFYFMVTMNTMDIWFKVLAKYSKVYEYQLIKN